jgi:hypothetical protein
MTSWRSLCRTVLSEVLHFGKRDGVRDWGVFDCLYMKLAAWTGRMHRPAIIAAETMHRLCDSFVKAFRFRLLLSAQCLQCHGK